MSKDPSSFPSDVIKCKQWNAALGTPSTANVTIADDVTEPAANPIDDSTNFVRQHYHDFLNREPLPADAAGLNFWVNQIESCGSDQACRDLRRDKCLRGILPVD